MSVATKNNIFWFKISKNNNLEAGLGQIWVGFIGRCIVTLRHGDPIDQMNSRRSVTYLDQAIVMQCHHAPLPIKTVQEGFGLVRVYILTHAIFNPGLFSFWSIFHSKRYLSHRSILVPRKLVRV